MKRYLPIPFFSSPGSPDKAVLAAINRLLFLPNKASLGTYTLLLCFFLLTAGSKLFAQAQVIGSFPEMQGGIENQALGFLPIGTANYPAGTNVTTYSRNNNNSSVTVEIRSTGGYASPKVIDWANASTSSGIFTPTAAADAVLPNTSYVVQFFARQNTSSADPFFQVVAYTNGSNGSTEITTPQRGSAVYQKFTAIVTTPADAGTGKRGYIRIRPKGSGFNGLTYLVDDICMYPGVAVDNTPPDDAIAPVITSFSPTSLDVSWTAPATGTDGGGYVVVRYTSDPTGQPAPNNNGIYAVGNTIGTGTVAYIGTGTSFTNTGLAPSSTYYYRVYVADKAFNYSLTPPVVIGFTGLGGPTLVTFTTPPGCATDQIILSWTGPLNYNATNNTILAFLKAGSAVTVGTPTNLPSTYNPSTNFSAPILPNYQGDAAARCIYRGDGTNAAGDHTGLTITGLAPNTTYHVLMFNVVDAVPTYSAGTAANGTTLAAPVAEPTNHPTLFAKGTLTTANVPVTWTAAVAGAQAPLGYLLQASVSATPADAVDGTDIVNQTDLTSGTANVKVTPNSAVGYSAFTGFTAGTMYYFRVNSYTNAGSCINYKAAGATMNAATLPNAVVSPSMAINGATADISWTAAPGYIAGNHTTLVFVKPVSAVGAGTPTIDPAGYTANTNIALGTVYQHDGAARCVYNGDGNTVTVSGIGTGAYHVLILTVVSQANSDGTHSYSVYATTTATTGNIYTWDGSFNNSWNRNVNWTPDRNTPASTDILIINLGGTFTIDSVSFNNETIAQLQVLNNTIVTLRNGVLGSRTLTITSNNGPLNPDLIVSAGSSLTSGISGRLVNITLGLNTSTADISGFMQVAQGGTYNTDAVNALTTVSGTLRNSGTVTSTSVARVVVTATGTYEHTHTTGGGAIPTATWQSGSTCLISGFTSATAFANTSSGHGQAFSNFIWDCPNQTSTFVLGAPILALPWAAVFAENFIVKRTGNSTGVLALTSPASTGNIQRNFTVGNFYQRSGRVIIALNTNNSGSPQRSLTVNGIFSVTDSSAAPASSFEILNAPAAATNARLFVNGNVDMFTTVTSATLANITPGVSSTAEIWFGGSTAQTARFQTISGNIDFNINHTGTGVTLLSNATANRFLFTQGRFFINGNTLTINNAISYPVPGTGVLGGSSTSNLTLGLSGAAGELRFTPGFRTLKDLTQLAGNQASLGTELAIAAGSNAGRDSLGVGASLETNDNLILRSDADGTARIARIPVNGLGVAQATITEKVTVERYLPIANSASSRRWRLLTAPFTSTSPPTINEAWQGGVSNPDRNNPAAFDPRPGYSTLITKSTLAVDGFDQGSTNNPSIYFYSAATPGFWKVPASTNGIKITDSSGCFMLFARGDRSIVISNQFVAAVPTTLEPKGVLNLGRVTIPAVTPGNYQTVGNPYASQIKLDNVTFNGTPGISSTVYIWDPKTDGLNNTGKFITCSGNGSSYIYSANTSGFAAKPGVIESSGAFMVQSTGGNIVFNESDKTTESTTIGIASRPSRQPGPRGRISTFYVELVGMRNGEPSLADGIAVSYNKGYKNSIDNLDAFKLSAFNTREDLAIKRDGSLLSIERRKEVEENDTVFLNISKLNMAAYQFNLKPVEFDNSYTAYIEDNYTGFIQQIDLTANAVFDFSITADSATSVHNRFHIIFKRTKTAIPPVTKTGFTVFPNPIQNGLMNVQMNGMEAGLYQFTLVNKTGQTLQAGRITYAGGNYIEQIELKKGLSKGMYELLLLAPGAKTSTAIPIMIQ